MDRQAAIGIAERNDQEDQRKMNNLPDKYTNLEQFVIYEFRERLKKIIEKHEPCWRLFAKRNGSELK